MVERGEKIIASFPYYKKKIKGIFSHIGMPLLTQKLGPYIDYGANILSNYKKISYEHEIYTEFIEKLPKTDSFSVNFDLKYSDWLPFYWKGYKQTTKYTYIIENIKNHDALIKQYSKSKKHPLNKAKDVLSLKYDLPAGQFYKYFEEVVRERGDNVGFSLDLFTRLYNSVYEHNSGKVFYCVDAQNNIHAINMIVWDKESAYYLLAMRKKEYNTSGGTEFLTDESIKYVSQFVDRFDFEGSMIKGVEESYRHYGSRQTAYFNINKYNSLPLRLLRAIKNI